MVAPAVLGFAVSYLLGSIPIGLIVGKLWRGIDIREFGSGNIGASNILRTLGPAPGAVVSLGDTLKGVVAVLVCKALGLEDLGVVFGGLLSVVGHNWSVFLNFSGGRGVATALGILIGMDWRVAAIGLASWIAVVALSRYISLASLVAVAAAAAAMTAFNPHRLAFVIVTWLMAAFIYYKHIPNIKRLREGSEFKIGEKVSPSHEVPPENESAIEEDSEPTP